MFTCADETVFHEKLDALKTSSKEKDSKTLFISDDFYENQTLTKQRRKIMQLSSENSGLCRNRSIHNWTKDGRII